MIFNKFLSTLYIYYFIFQSFTFFINTKVNFFNNQNIYKSELSSVVFSVKNSFFNYVTWINTEIIEEKWFFNIKWRQFFRGKMVLINKKVNFCISKKKKKIMSYVCKQYRIHSGWQNHHYLACLIWSVAH